MPVHHLLFVIALSDVNQDLINNTNNMILILIIFISFYIHIALSYILFIAFAETYLMCLYKCNK